MTSPPESPVILDPLLGILGGPSRGGKPMQTGGRPVPTITTTTGWWRTPENIPVISDPLSGQCDKHPGILGRVCLKTRGRNSAGVLSGGHAADIFPRVGERNIRGAMIISTQPPPPSTVREFRPLWDAFWHSSRAFGGPARNSQFGACKPTFRRYAPAGMPPKKFSPGAPRRNSSREPVRGAAVNSAPILSRHPRTFSAAQRALQFPMIFPWRTFPPKLFSPGAPRRNSSREPVCGAARRALRPEFAGYP